MYILVVLLGAEHAGFGVYCKSDIQRNVPSHETRLDTQRPRHQEHLVSPSHLSTHTHTLFTLSLSLSLSLTQCPREPAGSYWGQGPLVGPIYRGIPPSPRWRDGPRQVDGGRSPGREKVLSLF